MSKLWSWLSRPVSMGTVLLMLVGFSVGSGLADRVSEASTASSAAVYKVYVVDKTGPWPVRQEVRHTDKRIGSWLVFRSRCPTDGRRCLIIRERRNTGRYAYATCNPVGYYRNVITLDRSQRYRSYSAKRRIIRHELGHVFGLCHGGTDGYGHRSQCANPMYWAIPDRCGGRMSGWGHWTSYQKNVLRSH